MGNAAVSWESRKQKTVALSSAEAEYMSLAEAAKETIFLRGLLVEITEELSIINILNDNQSATKLTHNAMCSGKTKHIDIKYHFIREAIESQFVKLHYLTLRC